MTKNRITLWFLSLIVFSGCVSPFEPVETTEPEPESAIEKADPISRIAEGTSKTEVLNILGHPDYESSSGDLTILFFCKDLTTGAPEGICTPIFFQDDQVTGVGADPSKKWPVDLVRWKVDAEKKKKKPTKKKKEPSSGGLKEETLIARANYTPKEGDRVYVNYYRNFVRYVPLREDPSGDGEILKTLCIGSELLVLDVKNPWVYVKGIDEDFIGWILQRWLTDDRGVKIDAEKIRKENAPEIARLEAIVRPIPQSKWRQNLSLYEKLLDLDSCNPYYQRKVDFYERYGRKRGKR